jgi:hypothetical protein
MGGSARRHNWRGAISGAAINRAASGGSDWVRFRFLDVGLLSEKTKQNQNLSLLEGAQGRTQLKLQFQIFILSHFVAQSH